MTGLLGLIRRRRGSDPASSVDDALTRVVRPGDVVWDVGAGEGKYCELFCTLVGNQGLVVAFEPRPGFNKLIRERVPNCEWLRVEGFTLGEFDSAGPSAGCPPAAEPGVEAASFVSGAAHVAAPPLNLRRGDTVCREFGADPNVMRIDVRGFEEAVLLGMGVKLASLVLREVIVIVDFPAPKHSLHSMAPNRLQGLLSSMGFETRWIAGSHLFASRSRGS